MAGVIHKEDLKRIAGFSANGSLVVSLYLDVDGAKYPRIQDYERELHGLEKKAEDQWLNGDQEISKEKKVALKKDLKKINSFVTGKWHRQGHKGLAIFSCVEAGFWEVYEFPVGLTSALTIGHEPHTVKLTALMDEHKRFCVVSVNRNKSRFFTVYLGGIEEHHGVLIDDSVPDQVKEGEWAGLRQSRIARHIEDHVQRHLKEVARLTYNFFLGHNFDLLVVAGHKELIPRFESLLHPYLKERLAGEFQAEPDAPLSEIIKRGLLVEKDFRVHEEQLLFERLNEENHKGGLGVVGLKPTIDALMRGQADTLLLAADSSVSGFICQKDRCLSLESGGCRVCGEALSPSKDIVEDMVQIALVQNVKIEHLSHVEKFRAEAKYGALLRFGL